MIDHPTYSTSPVTRRAALAGLGAAGAGLAFAAARPANAQEANPQPAFASELPAVAYQGEVASRGGNPIPIFVSPRGDLVAKPGSSMDSWFLLSHLQSPRGTLDTLIHFLQLVPPGGGEGVLAVMASVLDASTGRFVSEERRFPAGEYSLATEACEVISPIAAIRGDATALNFTGEWAAAGIAFDLTASQSGPMLANAGVGLFPFLGGITYEYALPTMTTTGIITIGGESVEASGISWLDRQWGDAPAQPSWKWVWFGISLDDGTRISLWDLIEPNRRHPFATILHPSGAHEVVAVEPTAKTASRLWTSPATGRVYPTRWDVHMPQIDSRLAIEPEVLEQEFVSPDEAGHKYEAAAFVTGTLHGQEVTGYATIELVGAWV